MAPPRAGAGAMLVLPSIDRINDRRTRSPASEAAAWCSFPSG